MRPSTVALGFLAALAAVCLLIFGHFFRVTVATEQKLTANRALVEKLGLTDLALFTEARYTRHPTQADLHSALQDHPGAFDHFPSGSLLPPPAILTQSHAHLVGKTTTPD
jgi:hypothetical protein